MEEGNGMIEIQAVIIGVVCGIAAGIPVCWMLLSLMTRNYWRNHPRAQETQYRVINDTVVEWRDALVVTTE